VAGRVALAIAATNEVELGPAAVDDLGDGGGAQPERVEELLREKEREGLVEEVRPGVWRGLGNWSYRG
jgi:hypothetical protein